MGEEEVISCTELCFRENNFESFLVLICQKRMFLRQGRGKKKKEKEGKNKRKFHDRIISMAAER